MFGFFKKGIEEKRKKEEEKRKKEKEIEDKYHFELTNELKDSYSGIAGIWNNCFFAIDTCRELLLQEKIELEDEKIFDTFFEIYKISKSTSTLEEFDEVMQSKGVSLILNKLQFRIPLCNEINCSELKYLYKVFDIYQKIEKSFLYSCSIDIFAILNQIIEQIKESLMSNSKSFHQLSSQSLVISALFCYLESLVRSLIIYRNKDKLLNNFEFNEIQSNLYNELKLEDAGTKLHELYLEFYKETFQEIYSLEDLTSLINIVNHININGTNDMNFIKELNSIIDEDLEELINEGISYDTILYLIKKFMDLNIVDNLEIGTLYLELIDELKENLNDKQIFSLLSNSRQVLDDSKKYEDKKRLLEEKNRYLNGDFSKENIVISEQLKLSLVSSGQEFEIYLKELFEKQGYYVELTKTTGDQGADLIITKNDVKIVVQAKFYSNPVGNKAVQEIVAAIAFYGANQGMVITNNYYTNSAKELAEANNIILWDGEILKRQINELSK